MSFSIRIDEQKRLVVSTFIGRLTADDITEGRRALSQNPAFKPAFAHILDMTAVSEVDLPEEVLQQLSRDSSLFDKSSVQVVVAPQKSGFNLARMFQASSATERPSLQVTRSLDAAYALVALKKD